MNGEKIILFGIAVILFGIAISTMNFFGFLCGGIGVLVALFGLFRRDGSH